MDASLNFVALVESNPLTRLSQDYNNRFITKIQEMFTEQQQQMFVASMYCFLNHHPTNDYIVDLDNIWPWLGFSTKQKAKTLLETQFVLNKDFRRVGSNLPNLQVKQDGERRHTHGGHNKEIFMMNINTFKLFCIKADTKKAQEIHEYFVKLEELLQQIVQEETDELKQQFEQLKEAKEQTEQQLFQKTQENEVMQLNKNSPTMYIYNTDTRVAHQPLLKIGVTRSVYERIKPYKTTHPYGKLEYHQEVDCRINIRTFEHSLHAALDHFKERGEVFAIDLEEAVTAIRGLYRLFTLQYHTNASERKQQIKQYHDYLEHGTPNEAVRNVHTREMSTQTDYDPTIPATIPLALDVDVQQNAAFDAFIREHCLVRPDVEVAGKDILGQYRLHCRQAKKEITTGFTNYLNKRFIYTRLAKQTKDQVVMGYRGVILNDIVYAKSLSPSDEEIMVLEKCVFTPSGTALYKDIWDEYKNWKRIMNLPLDEAADDKKLKAFLKGCPYVLFDTVWASGGSGQGFYGIQLKRESNQHRKSSTGSVVQKKDKDGRVLCEFDTIAKAAAEEGFCPAKMSRAIRDRVTFTPPGDEDGANPALAYYYAKKTSG